MLGSSVLLSPLNAQAIPNGALYSTQTTNNFGEFQLDLDVAGPVSIEGTGFYYNEVTGTLSLAPLTLRALFNVAPNSARTGEMAGAAGQPEGGSGAQSAYVNLITHLAYFRVKTLALSGNVTLSDAIRKAEAEVRSELGIGPTALAPTTPATQMNLLGGDNLANAYSFAVGTVLAQAAARRTGPIDANLQELLNSISSDLAEDGVLSPAIKQELKAAIAAVDPEAVMTALAARLQVLGSTAAVPNLNRILDSDFDGFVNAEDCRRRDPLRWTHHADLDGDGHEHVDCGGDDCDDDQATCFPGNVEQCQDSLDNDCNGVVDEGCFCLLQGDVDGDGHERVECDGDDCDDNDPNRFPGNAERCEDSLDNDCDDFINNGCPCPGTFGPAMVRLPQNYCIDSTEVTRAQYADWVLTTPSTLGQMEYCLSNTDYAPNATCMSGSAVCQGDACSNHPQVCVDWCDAYAFCEAAGKRLCGKLSGGSLDFTYDDPGSQWYRACSSGGLYKFPYGNTYSAWCNVSDYGANTTVAVGSLTACQSPAKNYQGIVDMSGNVYEWEDNCRNDVVGGSCRIQGGAYSTTRNFDDAYGSCRGMPLGGGRAEVAADRGFRCCSK